MALHSFLSIRCAHMIKTVATNLMKTSAGREQKKLTMVIFAALQRCHDVRTAVLLYGHAYVLFCSERTTSSVVESHGILRRIIAHHELQDEVSDAECEGEEHKGEGEYAEVGSHRMTSFPSRPGSALNRNLRSQVCLQKVFHNCLTSYTQAFT